MFSLEFAWIASKSLAAGLRPLPSWGVYSSPRSYNLMAMMGWDRYIVTPSTDPGQKFWVNAWFMFVGTFHVIDFLKTWHKEVVWSLAKKNQLRPCMNYNITIFLRSPPSTELSKKRQNNIIGYSSVIPIKFNASLITSSTTIIQVSYLIIMEKKLKTTSSFKKTLKSSNAATQIAVNTKIECQQYLLQLYIYSYSVQMKQ